LNVYLKALGCRLNEAELEQWSQQFQSYGYTICRHQEDADLLVLNTCSVTSAAGRKSRQLVRRLHRDNPTARFVVTGCHASLNAEETADQLGVDLVIPNDQKDQLVNITKQELALPTMPLSATEPDDIALYSRGRHRAFVKVQDGCRYRCTYCIVTLARGEEHSRSIADIIADIQRFHEQGINEAVLTGVHVGGYGSDTGSSLFELIKAILNDTDIPRLRLASVEPWDLPENFFSLFDNLRLMPHMHLPLQSGCDSVLKRMARRCKTTKFAALVDKARSAVTGFNITTDVIAGFPGETDAEWAQTLRFVEEQHFGRLHIFPYSPRLGTKAAGLPNQINKTLKQERCKALASLDMQARLRSLNALVGTDQEVLWEKPSPAKTTEMVTYSGYTPNYQRVQTTVNEATRLEYCITPTLLTRLDRDGEALCGEIRDEYSISTE
jgi:threonylcarbamoyladenosine tRNA methylthiotransferase MtaB